MAKDHLIGSVLEFDFGNFFAYALVTHYNKKYGHLLRLFKPKFVERVSDIGILPESGIRMSVYFPLKYVSKGQKPKVVGKLPLSGNDLKLPKFKSPGLFAPGEKAKGWRIIDGENEKWVDELTEEMSHYSPNGVYNFAALKQIFEYDLYPNSPVILNQGPLAFEPNQT